MDLGFKIYKPNYGPSKDKGVENKIKLFSWPPNPDARGVLAEELDRALAEMDALALDVEAVLGELGGDFGGADRAEHLASFAGLDGEDELDGGQLGGGRRNLVMGLLVGDDDKSFPAGHVGDSLTEHRPAMRLAALDCFGERLAG